MQFGSLLRSTKLAPAECLRKYIECKQYDLASELVVRCKLNEEPLRKAQWLDAQVNHDNIKSYLSRVEDLDWVLNECTRRTGDSPGSTRALLKHGIKVTGSINADDVLRRMPEPLHICRHRTLLFYYLDLLDTHESIYVDAALSNYGEHYAWFRSLSIMDIAVGFAVDGNCTALEAMLTRHGNVLLPYRWSLLELFPESTEPSKYYRLVPQCQNGVEIPFIVMAWRKSDWSESPAVRSIVDWQPPPTVVRTLPSASHPLTVANIIEWLQRRIQSIEAAGCPSLALGLATIASKQYDLKEMVWDLTTLCTLIYEGYSPGSREVVDLTLSKIQSATESDIVNMFMGLGSDLPEIARRYVGPYLERANLKNKEQRISGDAARMFGDWIVSKASEGIQGLELAVKMLETSTDEVPKDKRVIHSRITQAQVVLETAYLSTEAIPSPLLERLASCAPDLSDLSSNDSTSSDSSNEALMDDLAIRLEVFKCHLVAIRILSRHKIPVVSSWISSVSDNIHQQKDLCRQLVRQFARCDLGMTDAGDATWKALFDDMMELRGLGVLGLVGLDELYGQFVAVALTAGRFGLVKDLLSGAGEPPPLSDKEAEMLVLNASREFYDNAESGDSTTGLMRMAFDCLRILPANKPNIRAEMDLIEATHALFRVPNLDILPMQIRMSPDRISLIQQAVKAAPSAVNNADRWLEIGRKLSSAKSDSFLTEIRVRAYIADAAIDFENWKVASTQCNGLVLMIPDNKVIDVVWQVCLRLAVNPKYEDLDNRAKLLGHVTALCPPGQIGVALDCWAHCSIESTYSSVLGKQNESHLTRMQETVYANLPKVDTMLPTDRLSLHEFYQSPMSKTTVGVYICDADRDAERPSRLLILQLLARIRALQLSDEWKSVSKMMQEQGELQHYDVSELVKAAFMSDAVLSLCALLGEQGSKMDDLFDTLPPLTLYEQFGMYSYALKAMCDLSTSAESCVSIHDILSMAPAAVVRSAQAIKHILEGNTEFDNEVWQFVKDDLERGLQFAERTKNRRQQSVAKDVATRQGVDVEKFSQDAQYRRVSLLALSETVEVSGLAEAIKSAEQFGVGIYDICIHHVCWMFQQHQLPIDVLKKRINAVRERLMRDASETLQKLRSLHPQVQIGDHERLSLLYALIRRCVESSDPALSARLAMRVALAEDLAVRTDLPQKDIRVFVRLNSLGPRGYLDYWRSINPTKGFADILTELLPMVLDLVPEPLFPDEATYTYQIIDTERTAHLIYQAHVTQLMDGISGAANTLSVANEIDSVLDVLTIANVSDVVHKLALARVVPVSARLQLIEHALSLSDGETDALDSLHPIYQQLHFIHSASKLSDPVTNEKLSEMFMGRLEWAVTNNLAALQDLVQSSISDGVSPRLVYGLVSLSPSLDLQLDLCQLYHAVLTQTLKSRSLDDIKRVRGMVESVTHWVVLGEEDTNDDRWAGTDSGIEVAFTHVGNMMRDEIVTVLEDTSLDAAVKLACVEMLEKNYAQDPQLVQKLQQAKLAALVKESFGMDISAATVETPESRRNLFTNLLQSTQNASAFQSLLTLLQEWSQTETDTSPYFHVCWRDMLLKLAEMQMHQLLLDARLSMPHDSVLDEELEARLLNFLKGEDPTQHFLHGLLSEREMFVSRSIEALVAYATSSDVQPPPQNLFTRLLFIIACGRGLAPRLVDTQMWRAVQASLLEDAPVSSDALDCRRAVVSSTVADLTLAGQVTAAASLAGQYMISGCELVLSLSARVGILRQLLGMGGNTSSVTAPSAGSQAADETRSVSEGKIEARVLIWIVSLLPDIKGRSGEALGLLNTKT
ncbi:hypothetical protein SeMB42_g01353 [Synchytrium endobioticum]|uniref:Sec39 domain-containing protein n=1 Tax=Synchytrium endobioticum TaxID=286115 RepID=A0A507DDC1_9FUNG|nr:hypothetical protein SeLEV6574_g01379 [Synchytrium endobioticum]TPX52522.1 hypothetical protein SeMB42_g01353 [Synchytrium endobioticum]